MLHHLHRRAGMGRDVTSMVDLSAIKELLRISEVASLLGVTQATVYRWVRGGRLRAVTVGGQLRIPPAEIQSFLGPEAGALPDAPGEPVEILEAILEQIRTLAVDGLAELRER
jgi:excisionase family DNA binding protein